MPRPRRTMLTALIPLLLGGCGEVSLQEPLASEHAELQQLQERYTGLLARRTVLSEAEFGSAYADLAYEVDEWNVRVGLLEPVITVTRECHDPPLKSAAETTDGKKPIPTIGGGTTEPCKPCPLNPPPDLIPDGFYICRFVKRVCDASGRSCHYSCAPVFSWLPPWK